MVNRIHINFTEDGEKLKMSYEFYGKNEARLQYDEPNNLVDFYRNSVQKYPDNLVIGERDANSVFHWTTYREFGERIDRLRAGIAQLGIIQPGDKIGIIMGNSLEWAIGAFATFGLRACWVPMYEKELHHTWEYIIKDSGMKIVFVKNQEIYEIVKKFQSNIPTLQKIFIVKGEGENSFSALEELGKAHPIDPITPDIHDDAAIIYTSGTTGDPKGVILTHGNFAANSNAGSNLYPEINNTARALSILPWAHSYAMTAELYTFVKVGASIGITDVDHLSEDLSKTNPTHLICVPRLFNKIYQGIHKIMEETGGIKYKLFLAAKKAAKQKRETGKSSLKLKILDKLVFSKVRAKFGNRLYASLTASAKTELEVANFFFDIGLPIYDCYGMTETAPAITMNCERYHRLGSVGKPIEYVKVVIDKSMMPEGSEDGEIIAYGPNVMKGYLNKPEKTAEIMVKDENGIPGVRTGDLGRLDEDNFLYITGRIKNEYKLLNGKYVHPAEIEEFTKILPWIANIFIYGDGRPFNIALIVPDSEYLQAYAKKQGISKSFEELVEDPKIQELIKEKITTHLRQKFGGYEIPKKFAFLTEDFTLENKMLTQTMKLKRRTVLDRYKNLIESLYQDVEY
ncbi:MAG: AMP-binding protein [Candidatus Lokiarchaeota archaeon]|nr:AMP-binding protein [Candidatus Harpocratesius repetitus]